MSIMIDDDDNDLVVDTKATKESSDKEHMKNAIQQGLNDVKEINNLFTKLSELLEPFGDNEAIEGLKVVYEEVVPNILLGKYDEIIEMLQITSNEPRELLEMRLKVQRKEYVNGLMNKYN